MAKKVITNECEIVIWIVKIEVKGDKLVITQADTSQYQSQA